MARIKLQVLSISDLKTADVERLANHHFTLDFVTSSPPSAPGRTELHGAWLNQLQRTALPG